MKYGLTDKNIEDLKGVLSAYQPIEKAIVYALPDTKTCIALMGNAITLDDLKEIANAVNTLQLPISVLLFSQITDEAVRRLVEEDSLVLFEMECEEEEWKEYKLEDITSRIGDGLHGTPQYDANGDYYFINGNNLNNGNVVIKADTKKVSKEEFLKYSKPLSNNTILISINGTIGNIAFYKNEKCILGKSACYINLLDNVDKVFLYYVFFNSDFQDFLNNIATGTTIPNVPLKGLREAVVKLPSLKKQKQIANILSSLDDKIGLLNKQNATLEAMAETLFRQWFIEGAKED